MQAKELNRNYLQSLLGERQTDAVVYAVAHRIPILVTGDETRPTGKSTLAEYLRAHGAAVSEPWEAEFSCPKRNKTHKPTNIVVLTITLDSPLDELIPHYAPEMPETQENVH